MNGQEDFFGPASVWDKSRADLHKTLAALASSSAGVKEEDVLANWRASSRRARSTPATRALWSSSSRETRRQTGIHVSPTTTLNGMVCDTSSSWDLEQWRAFLDPHVRAAKGAA